jgi:putative ABC transport system ATP-binding protein
MAVVQELHRAGLTIVLVTHEPDIAQFAQRVLSFRDGELVGDERIASPRDARTVLQVPAGRAA